MSSRTEGPSGVNGNATPSPAGRARRLRALFARAEAARFAFVRRLCRLVNDLAGLDQSEPWPWGACPGVTSGADVDDVCLDLRGMLRQVRDMEGVLEFYAPAGGDVDGADLPDAPHYTRRAAGDEGREER